MIVGVFDGSTGAGITRDNVTQLLLHTGAREVHVGSACQENVPRTVPREDVSVRLGFVGEGVIRTWVNMVVRASRAKPCLSCLWAVSSRICVSAPARRYSPAEVEMNKLESWMRMLLQFQELISTC